MKPKYLSTAVFFCAIVSAAFLIFLYCVSSEYSAENMKSDLGGEMVSLNRIVNLTDMVRENPQNAAYSDKLKKEISSFDISRAASIYGGQGLLAKTNAFILLSLLFCIAFVLGFFLYIYMTILKPFGRLEKFAVNVADGNLDFPLHVERQNTFGAFSWAFDLMRTELKEARKSEKEALLAKKTLVATISHDIKTPVASIRAYAEALGGGMAKTPERQARYLNVIMRKADEVARLTDDLFLHAVSDMDKLSIEAGTFAAPDLINEILEPFFAQYGDKISLKTEIPDISVTTDARRLSQVFENIISNSAKYAENSDMNISFETADGYLVCGFEDFGGGIPPQDLPFVFDKFYRGKNSKDKKGSGLGLYIVKYIMEKTSGRAELENTQKGLLIRLYIKISGI